ncbi:protealysin inhibitor emfourin [Curtobacterium flaccumfaciens]|uniref:protealysin inhibitor emfourin n=1 Tax=Curtobacterium flaccumfaciens TaxID=2035 RepID=UPI0024A95006|nr:protealysin inhibitor emfourin [Curtobacterium flaccumfaciens]
MRIEVRRSGGFAGTTRRWWVDTDTSSDPTAWSDVVDALRRTPAPTAPPVPDDFSWTITVERTTVTIPGRRLDGPWADLVARVRSEGDPT